MRIFLPGEACAHIDTGIIERTNLAPRCALIKSPLIMKIDEIDAYVTVIRCQSLQQAALSLGLTQPAITRRLQNFEEALGVELLDCNTRPLKATATGLTFRRSRTQFGVNFVASRAGEMRIRPAG